MMMILPRLLTALLALCRSIAAYSTLSDSSVLDLPDVNLADFDIHNQEGILAPILVPRVPGTAGSEAVRQHFISYFNTFLPLWNITLQRSASTTPLSNGKEVPFVNVIATRDPPWLRGPGDAARLALVAHYDSKIEPEGFIGAVDSAAPCAMLLYAAREIDRALTKKWQQMEAQGLDYLDDADYRGIQLLLLDGEEAFLTWNHADSVYGARALAHEWEHTFYPAMSMFHNPLRSIELFVLLDLLGASDPNIPSYFKTTHWAYQYMAALEDRLRRANRMLTKPKRNFLPEAAKTDAMQWLGGRIDDDHRPFQQRGVEVLHLIPVEFPHVWHTMNDDGEHLDMNTVIDWTLLTTAFAAEWMELDGFFDTHRKREANESGTTAHEKTEL